MRLLSEGDKRVLARMVAISCAVASMGPSDRTGLEKYSSKDATLAVERARIFEEYILEEKEDVL